MNYTKPEVVLAGSTLAAIHSVPAKPHNTMWDQGAQAYIGTANAYEADE